MKTISDHRYRVIYMKRNIFGQKVIKTEIKTIREMGPNDEWFKNKQVISCREVK